MQIGNVLAGHPDSTKLGQRAEPVESAMGKLVKANQATAATPAGGNTAAAKILARYNVNAITPSQFSTMVQKLYEAGGINDAELQELTGIRRDLDAAGIKPDEQVNLMEFYSQQVSQLQRRSDDPAKQQLLAPTLKRLQWVEKFSTIQQHPDSVGLNALA